MTSQTRGRDVSGYGNNGRVGNVLTHTAGIHGQVGGAMYFPGGDPESVINIANEADSSLQLSRASFSISGFHKAEPGTGGPIIAYYQGGPGDKVWFFGNGDGEIRVLSDRDNEYLLKTSGRSNPYVDFGDWFFFTLIYDMEAGTLSVWKNGVLFESKGIPTNLTHKASVPMFIGKQT